MLLSYCCFLLLLMLPLAAATVLLLCVLPWYSTDGTVANSTPAGFVGLPLLLVRCVLVCCSLCDQMGCRATPLPRLIRHEGFEKFVWVFILRKHNKKLRRVFTFFQLKQSSFHKKKMSHTLYILLYSTNRPRKQQIISAENARISSASDTYHILQSR